MIRVRIKEKEIAFSIWPIVIVLIVLFLIFYKGGAISYNELYDEVINSIESGETDVDISRHATDSTIKKVGYRIINGSPEYFHIVNSYSYSSNDKNSWTFSFSYNSYADNYEKNLVRYREMIKEIASQVDETYTDYDKALWLHDYMIDNFSYDYNYSSYSSLSMLDNKKGICSSYALLYKDLLEEVGIKNEIVIGKTEGGYGPTYKLGLHCWNIVKIGRFWYHIDTTWDDTLEGRYTYFMVSDSYMKKHYHYSWFCVDGKKHYCWFNKNDNLD